MNLQTNIKSKKSTVVFFICNAVISAMGTLFAHKTALYDAPHFSAEIITDKLFCVDAFMIVLLCFLCFCGLLALLSLPLSFLFSFFNSYAVFISIKAGSISPIPAVFSCFLLAFSLILFCIGSQFCAQTFTDFALRNKKQRINVIFDFFTVFIPGIASFLLMFITSTLIM